MILIVDWGLNLGLNPRECQTAVKGVKQKICLFLGAPAASSAASDECASRSCGSAFA